MRSHIHFAILVQRVAKSRQATWLVFTTWLRHFWRHENEHKTKQRRACEGEAEAALLFFKSGRDFHKEVTAGKAAA